MKLSELIGREVPPQPWTEGEKIPWNDPGFSARMLAEHLSQEHDAASRRNEVIDRQVAWIHAELLGGHPGRVLDLGCGPGLYTRRLAGLGHTTVGIDYGPASIAHARRTGQGLACTYLEQDLREAEYGQGYDLVMLIFGEFNVFPPAQARSILAKVYAALAEGGRILLEVSTLDAVQRVGDRPASWYTASSGLFSAEPHLCLQESFWNAKERVAIERWYVVDAATGKVTRHAASTQAYIDAEYRAILLASGFSEVVRYPSLTGLPDPAREFVVFVGRR